jgi:phenylpropionate dioxygenase-like ring-hydroxylating dioxygenase large terminal subunit
VAHIGRLTAAVQRSCPHRGGNLADGWVRGDCVVCPYHGWEYGPDGRCRSIPHLEPNVPIPPEARVGAVHAADRYGLIWVCPGTPTGGPPSWSEGDDDRFRVYVEFFEDRSTSAPRVVDNALDSAHVTFVHRGTFASGDALTLPLIPDVTRTADGRPVGRFVFDMPGVGQQMGVTGTDQQAFERVTEIELLGPLTVRTRFKFSEFPDGARDYAFLGGATPLDDVTSRYFRVTALGGTDDEHPFAAFHEFAGRVQTEDRRILDGTDPSFPLDITSEVHLRMDRLTLEYRRYLAELADRVPPASHGSPVRP